MNEFEKNKLRIYTYRLNYRQKYNEYQRILQAKIREYKRSNDYDYTAKIQRHI